MQREFVGKINVRAVIIGADIPGYDTVPACIDSKTGMNAEKVNKKKNYQEGKVQAYFAKEDYAIDTWVADADVPFLMIVSKS